MAKSNYKYIKSLNQFVKEIGILTKDTPKGFYVFRGQGNHGDEVQSGAYRRLESSYGKGKVTINKLIEYHEKIIEGAKNRSESHEIINDKCDLVVLGEIQHYGGATNLIDFTYNSLVALYFACKSNGDKNNQSKVYCLNTDSVERFSEINSNVNQNKIKTFRSFLDELDIKDDKKAINRFYKWIPPFENYRITKQDSIFIFNGEGKINDDEFDKILIIRFIDKNKILSELEKGFNIFEESLFPDFVGYVEANAAYKPLEKIDANYYFKIGLKLLQIKEYTKAIENFIKATDINSNDPLIWNNLGIAYAENKEFEEANKCFEKVISVNSTFYQAFYNLGRSYSFNKNYDKSIEYYKKAIELKFDYYQALYNLGIIYYNRKDYENSISCYKKAIEAKNDLYKAWYNMGIIYSKRKEKDEAINCYKMAIKIKPDYDKALNNLGYIYMNNENIDNSINCFLKALEIRPDYYEALNNIGIAYSKKGENDNAISFFKKAIEIKPSEKNSLFNLGKAYEIKGDNANAEECYKKAEELKKK